MDKMINFFKKKVTKTETKEVQHSYATVKTGNKKIIKCNHKIVDSIKGAFQSFQCSNRRCRKLIIKGKKTPDRAFGNAKVLRV